MKTIRALISAHTRSELRQTGRRSVDRGPSAVDEQRAAADVARSVGSEEGDRRRHLVGRTPAVEHRMGGIELMNIRPLFEWRGQRGLGDARPDRVDAYAKTADLGSEALDQQPDRRLGAAVDG